MKKLLLLLWSFVLLSCNGESDQPVNEEPALFAEPMSVVLLNAVLQDSFNDIVSIDKNSKTYAYLLSITAEALAQANGTSQNDLPLLYKEKNFPMAYNYYSEDRPDSVALYKTMIGWLCAMQLSELYPEKRNQLYKAGYEAGGFTMNSGIYGYQFDSDPNVARLVASAIYAAMHTTSKPDIETMRTEVGGRMFFTTLAEIIDEESPIHVTDDAFYVDLRQFMSSAPGPYASGYEDRQGNPTFPDAKNSNGCLEMDMEIYKYVVEEINLPEERAAQAISDKDADLHHIFGTDKRDIGGMYDFNAVFGPTTIKETIAPEGQIGELIQLVLSLGSSARAILQHTSRSLGPYEYGRLRPGCSENEEGLRKSLTNDRLNVLSCFLIEDNDGHKASYYEDGIEKFYYDENGVWTNASVQSEGEYEDMVKDLVYGDSYPSGYASGIWSAAMTLIELYPQKADLIMKAANDFAMSRVISRYNWNSDIIQGKVIGSAINPLCHASKDYNTLFAKAKSAI